MFVSHIIKYTHGKHGIPYEKDSQAINQKIQQYHNMVLAIYVRLGSTSNL